MATGAFLLLPAPIDPVAFTAGPALPPSGVLAPNDALRTAQIIGGGKFINPEDVTFDAAGRMYIPNRDISDTGKTDANPRIDRVTFAADGSYSVETFVSFERGGPLDLRFDASGNLIVAVWQVGLVSVSPNREVTVLVADGQMIDGKPFGYADGIAIARDGKIYFTQGQDAEGERLGSALSVLSNRDFGRLLVYDPQDGSVKVLLSTLSFANGVALAPDESYVLVADQYRYQIKRYWLTGEKAGTADIFTADLPGFVHNLYLDNQHVLWVAIFQPRNGLADALRPNPFLARQVAKLLALMPGFGDERNATRAEAARGAGSVLALNLEGRPLLSLQNPPMIMNTLSAAVYHDGYVYTGTIGGSGVLRYRLAAHPMSQQ
ncbi:MAG: SMP-30/gluconolactonase/LRE family protein [Anaerolineae bacterium]